jgi:translation initiation factor IF-1
MTMKTGLPSREQILADEAYCRRIIANSLMRMSRIRITGGDSRIATMQAPAVRRGRLWISSGDEGRIGVEIDDFLLRKGITDHRLGLRNTPLESLAFSLALEGLAQRMAKGRVGSLLVVTAWSYLN